MNTHRDIPRHPKVLVCLLMLAFLFCAAGCSFLEDDILYTDGASQPPRPSGPHYDQSAFRLDGTRYIYDDGATVARKTGIDVSDHQEEIDWHAVAADGIEFAFLRVGYRGNTEGGLFADSCFDANYQGAHEAGLTCGAYFYSQATSVEEAAEEASFVLGLLGGRPLEYGVAFDYEIEPNTRIAHVGASTASQISATFCEAIRAGGYQPMVYGNTFDLTQVGAERLDQCSIWCAEYDGGPSYAHKADVWQYTNQGYVNGIYGPVDLNLDLSGVY